MRKLVAAPVATPCHHPAGSLNRLADFTARLRPTMPASPSRRLPSHGSPYPGRGSRRIALTAATCLAFHFALSS